MLYTASRSATSVGPRSRMLVCEFGNVAADHNLRMLAEHPHQKAIVTFFSIHRSAFNMSEL